VIVIDDFLLKPDLPSELGQQMGLLRFRVDDEWLFSGLFWVKKGRFGPRGVAHGCSSSRRLISRKPTMSQQKRLELEIRVDRVVLKLSLTMLKPV
jgi:hypothetical protein